MSVVVFHPMVAPHVQQAALSLHEAGQLERLITSVRDDPSSFRQKSITTAGRLVGLDLGREFKRRAIRDIPLDRVETHPWPELARLAVGRLNLDERLTDLVWERGEKAFDRLVARRIHPGLTGVYGFEFGCLATFTRARELGLRTGYEMPAPDTDYSHRILLEELDRFPELDSAYHRHTSVRHEERTARRRAEWRLADVIIAASKFTRESYARAGLDVSRVRVIPLGAPPPIAASAAATGGSAGDGPLRLLWAGSFAVRKGAHYTIDAWNLGRFGDRAQLQIFGTNALPERIVRSLPPGITLRGSVPRSELMEEYARADALIFPTLCDGFGMVATEAWSRGLPVITTERAGAADLLQPEKNGILIRAGDAAAIATAIQWCLDNRGALRAMRETAVATAAAWQWADYRKQFALELRRAGAFGSGQT